MKKGMFVLGLLLLLTLVPAGCAGGKPVAAPETAPPAAAENAPETWSVTVQFYAEPVNVLSKSEDGSVRKVSHIIFKRNHAAGAEVIERLKGLVQNAEAWSADTPEREELYVDGGFGLSDDERNYSFCCKDKILYYPVFVMDPETQTLRAERYVTTVSEDDIAFILSLKDSKDGYKY